MPSTRFRRLLVATVQYPIGLALLPFEPQYGLLVIAQHHVIGRLRTLTPGERLYVTVAIAIHTVGVTYPEQFYRTVVWFDDVTHFMSGSLVAGLLMLVLSRRIGRFSWLLVTTVVALFVVGIGWEMYEYHTPRLRVYGWGDTVSDIRMNLFGGVAMVTYRRMQRWVDQLRTVHSFPSPTTERGRG